MTGAVALVKWNGVDQPITDGHLNVVTIVEVRNGRDTNIQTQAMLTSGYNSFMSAGFSTCALQ